MNEVETRLFRYSMWWRIFYGTLRIMLGLILLKVIDTPFSEILTNLMGYELTEDSSDIIYRILSLFLEAHPFTVTLFLSGYLLFWGTVDVFLSASLLRHKLWAFPITLGLIAFFIIYATYRFTHTHSLLLLSVIALDIIIFWLIRTEYIKWKFRSEKQKEPTGSVALD